MVFELTNMLTASPSGVQTQRYLVATPKGVWACASRVVFSRFDERPLLSVAATRRVRFAPLIFPVCEVAVRGFSASLARPCKGRRNKISI